MARRFICEKNDYMTTDPILALRHMEEHDGHNMIEIHTSEYGTGKTDVHEIITKQK